MGYRAAPVRRHPGAGRGPICGFTLIELLAVVAIVGIVLVVASVNFFPSEAQLSRRDAAAVATAVERARDSAWYGGVPTAITFEAGAVKPWRLAGSEWQPQAAKDEALPAVKVTGVSIDGQALEPGARLVFLADGLGTPFRVTLESRGLGWAVEGDAAGAVRVVRND